MRHWKRGVMLDGEKSVGHADENARRHAAELLDEENLILEAANMFEDRIRRRYGETSVVERKPSVRLDANILDLGKRCRN